MRNNVTRKKFLALFLSAMMVASAGAALASCTESESSATDSSSSSSVSTVKDDGVIKNAGFENDTLNEKTLIGTSVTGWSRSVNSTTSGSALSSKSASGIIDTADAAWKNLTVNNLTGVDKLTEEQAKSKWSSMSAKDKLDYYEAWKDANDDDDKDVDDLDFYTAFNIDAEDLPTVDNPLTHDWTKDKAADDTKVLMLHNEYYNSTYQSFGTAQKYTSSTSVSVKAGTSAQFSVWVKTSDLKTTDSYGNEQPAVNKGAYISITNTLGGTSLDPLLIQNINTENMSGLEDTNGWKQYKFYLQGASYADTTFTVVLGLGQGGGTSRGDYVNGYAFFDDIECKLIDNATYKKETDAYDGDLKKITLAENESKEDKTVNATNESYGAYAIDYSNAATLKDFVVPVGDPATDTPFLETVGTPAPTSETRNGKVYTAALNAADATTYPGLGISTVGDYTGVTTATELSKVENNAYVSAVYGKHFEESEFVGAEDKVLMLLSANGVAYTAKTTTDYTLAAEDYMGISFFVKTSSLNGKTGAGITLVNGDTRTSITSLDTTTIATTDLDEETKDIYEGWVQCFFFVSNETDKDLSFSLEFTFGPTSVVDTTKSSYYSGFAAFTKFEMYDFGDNQKAFECISSGTYTKTVSLTEKDTSAAGDTGFDAALGVPTDAIENGFALPKNYKGVYSDSAYVSVKNTDTSVNKHGYSGLLNRKYAKNEDGSTNENYKAILETLGGTNWESVFGNATQPLVIYNAEAQEKSYGYIGNATTIAADSYSTVSLRVKTNTDAFVYLVDTNDETHASMLSVGAKKTYWYNDDGDLCSVDPASETYNKRKHVAFKLQSNGLYQVNTLWEKYDAAKIDKNAYYANLGAYETDEDGNLVTGENAVTYEYTNKWRDFGKDGIAFYAKKGADNSYTYYADEAKKVLVNDLASVADLPTRTNGFDAQDLVFHVTNTGNEWATVTFYIHTGSEAKNYRLEVWCGDREGSAAYLPKAGSYLLLDSYSPDAVDEKFATLIDERAEEIENDKDLGVKYESVFSFYDTDTFLRYDAGADKNGVGNSYENYLSSAYSEGVAYLKYTNTNVYETYVDYTYAETAVAADVEEEETEDVTEETTTGEETNVWLLTSSIAIAAILVLAVISLIVRKVAVKIRKKRGTRAVVTVKKKDKKDK